MCTRNGIFKMHFLMSPTDSRNQAKLQVEATRYWSCLMPSLITNSGLLPSLTPCPHLLARASLARFGSFQVLRTRLLVRARKVRSTVPSEPEAQLGHLLA